MYTNLVVQETTAAALSSVMSRLNFVSENATIIYLLSLVAGTLGDTEGDDEPGDERKEVSSQLQNMERRIDDLASMILELSTMASDRLPQQKSSVVIPQPDIDLEFVGTEVIRLDSSVYRLFEHFRDVPSAVRCAEQLALRLNEDVSLAKTATVSRTVADTTLPMVQDLVIEDIDYRKDHGLKKYGIPLQPFDGNDNLVELYQELLDAVVYLRSRLYEKYGK